MNERHAPRSALRAIVDAGLPDARWDAHIDGCDHCSVELANEAAVVVMARALSAPERVRAMASARKPTYRWLRTSVSAFVVSLFAAGIVLGAAPAGSSPGNNRREDLSGGTPATYAGEKQARREANGLRLASLDAGAQDPLYTP